MAMTKKEQAAMQAAIDRAELLAALRWTSPVNEDVPPPTDGGYSEGWTFHAHSGIVERKWSGSAFNGRGPAPERGTHKSGQQGSIWMFSTQEKALSAMRNELEKMAAEELLAVDRRIASLAKDHD